MIRKISLLISEHWHMDGGVAFGVVPKGIWNKSYPADENNNLHIVNRLVLVETDKKLILFNAGFGNKRSEKYYSFKYITRAVSVNDCIQSAGYRPEDVTDVVFTHLHDDHCGGATCIDKNTGLVKPFLTSAKYWISEKQWHWAINPIPREAASYFGDNLLPLMDSGMLTLLNEDEQPFEDEGISFRHYNGHTAGQMIPFMNYKSRIVVYVSDFIPSSVHIPLPYVASVDISPMDTLTEKESFLDEAFKNNYILLFEHDSISESCLVSKSEKGYTAERAGNFSKLMI